MAISPEIILIAGPNGAGKTTFVNQLLQPELEGLTYVNADEIALEYHDLATTERNIKAGRAMLLAIDNLILQRQEIMIETTLATLTYARKIPQWQKIGYHVSVMYLSLPSADIAVQRVNQRVAAGGHNIQEDDICRRFERGWQYLQDHYIPIVDYWSIWEANGEGCFTCKRASDDE